MPVLLGDEEVDEWLISLSAALGGFAGFAGLWLHGSATDRCSWVRGVSDIDVLVGWRAVPGTREHTHLATALRRALVGCRYGEADVHVVTRDVARRPPPEPRYELYGAIHRAFDGAPSVEGPSTDRLLLLDLAVARSSGIAVSGPPADSFFGAIPFEWLLEAADQDLATWQCRESFNKPHSAVLQAARAWMLAVEARPASKLSAGRWARTRWSEADLIDSAIAAQQGERSATIDEPAARRLLAHARREIRTRIGGASASPG